MAMTPPGSKYPAVKTPCQTIIFGSMVVAFRSAKAVALSRNERRQLTATRTSNCDEALPFSWGIQKLAGVEQHMAEVEECLVAGLIGCGARLSKKPVALSGHEAASQIVFV